MGKTTARILLVLLLLSLVIFSCILSEDYGFISIIGALNDSQSEVTNQYSLQTLNATATYGAEQFRIQLTAMANKGK